jgi:hypothetical protein
VGEKGNLFNTSQEVFANLAEQGPQFWLEYQQYKDTMASRSPAPAVGNEADSQDPVTPSPAYPAAE